jgi:hypothetical protein
MGLNGQTIVPSQDNRQVGTLSFLNNYEKNKQYKRNTSKTASTTKRRKKHP